MRTYDQLQRLLQRETEERDHYVQQATSEIAYRNGRIARLKEELAEYDAVMTSSEDEAGELPQSAAA